MSQSPIGSARLPMLHGRPARIVLLVFRDADTDSRVLKSAQSLSAAGAEVLIIALAPYRSQLRAGAAVTPEGLALHRTVDLDLGRTFRPFVRRWRRLRRPDPRTGSPLGSSPPATSPSGIPRATSGEAPEPVATNSRTVARRRDAKRRLVDVYMRGYRTARLVRYWVGVIVAARRFRPDVVHANDANTLAPALVLRLLIGSRIVYDSHELWLRRNVRPDRWLAPSVEALTERLGVRLADAVITVSPSIATWLQERYALPEPPLLVRNVPLWRGTPPRQQGRLRELAGLNPQDRVVSYCGGITTGRGLEETVDALVDLPSDVHLVLLGFGTADYCAGLLDRARGRGVIERVHLVGQVAGPDVPRTLADADLAVVYVRPIVLSYRYCLPNKLFESIHAGLPIVVADLPDCASLVREHRVGEVFTTGTPAELASAIERVLCHATDYRAAARRLAPELDWRHEADRLIEAHTRAVQRCRP